MKSGLGIAMIVVGILLLVALTVFVGVALSYRHSFTSSDVPIVDFLEGLLLLSPVWLGAGALVFFGRRFMRQVDNG
jgi:hypothetical protein